MNLSNLHWSARDLDTLLGFIRTRKLSYQPFRFTDRHAVGEGLAFMRDVSDTGSSPIIDWPDLPAEFMNRKVSDADREQFNIANAELAKLYDYFVSFIKDAGEDFAEFGCNTGYFLYRLSQAGRKTVGLDFTYNAKVFDFFNRKLGTSARFLFSEWDSLKHRPRYHDVPMVDCCMSVAVLCHLADPLHHLTYLCSRARQAVFVWTPAYDSDDLLIKYGKPGLFANRLSWPVSFDNLVRPSRGLIELCLRESGFENITHIKPFPTLFEHIKARRTLTESDEFWRAHVGILAKRTTDAKTIYTGGRVRRRRPGDTLVPEFLQPLARRIKDWFR